jgi:hypothetical protein
MGYVEETGAAQYYRDVRVPAIYEGTNGIQAMDLVSRKMMDGGAAAFELIDEIVARARAATGQEELGNAVAEAAGALRDTIQWLVEQDLAEHRLAVAYPFLTAFARVLGADAHLAAALAGDGARERLACFYVNRLLPEAHALLAHVRTGGADVSALTVDDLAA